MTDGKATTNLAAFSITVAAAPQSNRAPVISGTPPTSVSAGAAYSFVPTASDPDKNTLSFSVQNKPVWASFSLTTGSLTGTPTTAQAGSYANIVISVSDGKLSAALPAFAISVNAAANRAPTISGTPATAVTVGSAYSFQPTAADADGDTLTFSVQNKPGWATFSTQNGKLSGTPAAGDAGTDSNIIITVTDGKTSVALPAFTITVNQVSTGSVTLNWTPPNSNTDGSTLSNLAGFHIYYGTSAGSLSQTINESNPGLTSFTVTNLASGTWYFAITSYTSAGVESAQTQSVSTTIP